MMRPKQNDINSTCFAVFASHYFKPTKVENDDHPDCATSDTTTKNSLALALPKKTH